MRTFREPRLARLVIVLAVYGGVLGFAMTVITFMARARPWETPAYSWSMETAALGVAGAVTGLLVAGAIVRWAANDPAPARGPVPWAGLGFVFGIGTPLLTGAVLPAIIVVLAGLTGRLTGMDLLNDFIDSFFRAPWALFTHGAVSLPAGLWAAAAFAIGGFAVDRLNASANHRVSVYGALALGLALPLVVLVALVVTPSDVLARLGWWSPM